VSHPERTRGTSDNTRLSILLWHWPYGKAYPLNGNVCLDLFKIPGCEVLDRRSEFSKVDVVVFHQRELATKKEKLPLNLERPHRQRWVWLSLEAPENNGNLQPFANLFNLTMSYRRDADITVPYATSTDITKEAKLTVSSMPLEAVEERISERSSSHSAGADPLTYMQELAADKERYEDFFRWRQEWRVKLYVDWRERLCKICTQSLPQRKVYSDLHKWYNV
uniref:Fucosyltransferase n=1 Tax=Neogobius melanostomus TaxID=47308 RepID=A0A8C6WJ09_9GOBI